VFDASDPLLDARPAEVLDLHGRSAQEVPALVREFLTNWQRRAPGGVVHIITGKGRGSAGGAVLKPQVAALLKTQLRALVADWDRTPDDGGYVIRLRFA
jgi:DNA-nicking Smr family endonuclease